MIIDKLNSEIAVEENAISPQTGEALSDTPFPEKCGCQSCGGKEIPVDDVKTRQKIERYRKKRHG